MDMIGWNMFLILLSSWQIIILAAVAALEETVGSVSSQQLVLMQHRLWVSSPCPPWPGPSVSVLFH